MPLKIVCYSVTRAGGQGLHRQSPSQTKRRRNSPRGKEENSLKAFGRLRVHLNGGPAQCQKWRRSQGGAWPLFVGQGTADLVRLYILTDKDTKAKTLRDLAYVTQLVEILLISPKWLLKFPAPLQKNKKNPLQVSRLQTWKLKSPPNLSSSSIGAITLPFQGFLNRDST